MIHYRHAVKIEKGGEEKNVVVDFLFPTKRLSEPRVRCAFAGFRGVFNTLKSEGYEVVDAGLGRVSDVDNDPFAYQYFNDFVASGRNLNVEVIKDRGLIGLNDGSTISIFPDAADMVFHVAVIDNNAVNVARAK